jgi:hypothetical protein
LKESRGSGRARGAQKERGIAVSDESEITSLIYSCAGRDTKLVGEVERALVRGNRNQRDAALRMGCGTNQ